MQTLEEYLNHLKINYSEFEDISLVQNTSTGIALHTSEDVTELGHELLQLAVKHFTSNNDWNNV